MMRTAIDGQRNAKVTRESNRSRGLHCGWRFLACRWRGITAAFVALATGASAQAQCPGIWIPRPDPFSITREIVCMRAWDPDGMGPSLPLLIIGGEFTYAGNMSAERIVAYNGSHFQLLGSGMTGGGRPIVHSLGEFNGELIAGGQFLFAGGQHVNAIARWNGNAWRSLGSITQANPPSIARVFAITVHNGELYAGGYFSHADGRRAENIARWDGSAWQPLGVGLNNEVRALCSFGGRLIAGGGFTEASGQPGRRCAAWDGTSWRAMGTDLIATVETLLVFQGQLIAGGSGFNSLRYDESAQDFVPLSVMGEESHIHQFSEYRGFLAGIGGIRLLGGDIQHIALWNGTRWRELHTGGIGGGSGANSLAEFNGGLAIGGFFSEVDRRPTGNWAIWTDLPYISSGPINSRACALGTFSFGITVDGAGSFAYQWQKFDPVDGWSDIEEGATAYGGGVIDAMGVRSSLISLDILQRLTLALPVFRCVVSNACGSVTSNPATLTICVADTDDGSGMGTCDGGVSIDDLLYYLAGFQMGMISADVDDGSGTGVPDGGVTIDDLLYYLFRFEAGC